MVDNFFFDRTKCITIAMPMAGRVQNPPNLQENMQVFKMVNFNGSKQNASTHLIKTLMNMQEKLSA